MSRFINISALSEDLSFSPLHIKANLSNLVLKLCLNQNKSYYYKEDFVNNLIVNDFFMIEVAIELLFSLFIKFRKSLCVE